MSSESGKSIFRSAVEGDDGEVDAGYLSIFALMIAVLGAIPWMCIFAVVAMYFDPLHKFDVAQLGIGVGAVCGGFATAVGAVGIFRFGDRGQQQMIRTRTMTQTATGQRTEQTTQVGNEPEAGELFDPLRHRDRRQW